MGDACYKPARFAFRCFLIRLLLRIPSLHFHRICLSDPEAWSGFSIGVGSLEWQWLASNQASRRVVRVMRTPITLQFLGNILAAFLQALMVCHTEVERILTRSMTCCHLQEFPSKVIISVFLSRICSVHINIRSKSI